MKKIGMISIFIFLTGLFAGLFFSTNLSYENSSYLQELLLSGATFPSSGFLHGFLASAVSNFTLVLLMLPALFFRLLSPLPLMVLWYKSFAVGFCSGLVYAGPADHAFLISLSKIFPQNLFFIPAFILLASVLFYCSVSDLPKKNRPSRQRKGLKHIAAASVALILAGCLMETICHAIVL